MWAQGAPHPSRISTDSRKSWCSVQPMQNLPLVFNKNWAVLEPVCTRHRAKQVIRSPWGATDHCAGTRCHCHPSSIPGTQQQCCVKPLFWLGTNVSKANYAVENHMLWKDTSKEEANSERQLWKPSTAIAKAPCSSQMEDLTPSCQRQEKGKEIVVRECQQQKWASATAGGQLLGYVNFIQCVLRFSYVPTPTKTLQDIARNTALVLSSLGILKSIKTL